MKKVVTALLFCGLIINNASADKAFWCGYKDYFRISSKAHPAIFISNATYDGDVYLQVMSIRSFILRDTPRCVPGYAHVTLMLNPEHWCVLDIKDGPWINHPKVQASCHGLHYKGTQHDGFGTHSYTINIA